MEEKIILSLQRNEEVFNSLLKNTPVEEYLWREREGKWNLLEIICHLYDEEREDFKARVKSVLENPEQHLPSIDPQGWVQSRNYSDQHFERVLDNFLKERKESVNWLTSLKDVNWNNTYMHPKIGPMSARLFLANWLAHDYLHIRQITRIRFHYLQQFSGQDLGYAGEW